MRRYSLNSFTAKLSKTATTAFLTATVALAATFGHADAVAAPSQDEARHREAVVRIARENRLDPALLMAVVKVESNFDAKARNPDGPVGLTQITPNTARSIEPGIRHTELMDPENNLRVGARHLRQLLDQFKDPRMAIAAYQAGVGAARNNGRGILRHPHTSMHVTKVMREYDSYRRQPAMQSEVGADNSEKRNIRKAASSGAGRSGKTVKANQRAASGVKSSPGVKKMGKQARG